MLIEGALAILLLAALHPVGHVSSSSTVHLTPRISWWRDWQRSLNDDEPALRALAPDREERHFGIRKRHPVGSSPTD